MNFLKAAGLWIVLLTSVGGVASAQTGTMGSMDSKPMMASKSDMMKMDKCKGMDHDMMMKSHTCMKMMKVHPDMMKGDTQSDSMMAPK